MILSIRLVRGMSSQYACTRVDGAIPNFPQVWWSKVATTAAHAGMGGLLYWRARRTDLESSKSIYDCYMFVWRLFYCEYLLLPLFR